MSNVTTKARLAELFSISLPTVDAWVRRGMPYEREGSNGEAWAFDLRECIKWREQDLIAKQVSAESGSVTPKARQLLEDRPHWRNYLRANADEAGLNLLNYQTRHLPAIMTALREKGLSKAKSYDAAVDIYMVLAYAYVWWIVNDVFNIEAADGGIDRIWHQISGQPTATRPPENEDDVAMHPPPDWLRMIPGEFVHRYWKGTAPNISDDIPK